MSVSQHQREEQWVLAELGEPALGTNTQIYVCFLCPYVGCVTVSQSGGMSFTSGTNGHRTSRLDVAGHQWWKKYLVSLCQYNSLYKKYAIRCKSTHTEVWSENRYLIIKIKCAQYADCNIITFQSANSHGIIYWHAPLWVRGYAFPNICSCFLIYDKLSDFSFAYSFSDLFAWSFDCLPVYWPLL